MKMKGIYTRERFTEEEVDIMETASSVVCELFGITVEELRSKARNFPIPDARKIVSHYICNNVQLENVFGEYNVALPTWYLDKNHTSVCYYVQQADELYVSDKIFRHMYDKFVDVMNGICEAKYQSIVTNTNSAKKEYTWEMVRKNAGFPIALKEALIPKKVSDRVLEMYDMGYSIKQITYYCKSSDTFVKYYINKYAKPRDNKKLSLSIRKSYKPYKVPYNKTSTTIDY